MTFLRESPIKAVRKARQCSGCLKLVNVGEPAKAWAGMVDGNFNAVIYHPECRVAEIELNGLHDSRDQDDWMSLHEIEWDDHDWLLAEHPAVAARFGLTAESVAAVIKERAETSAKMMAAMKKGDAR